MIMIRLLKQPWKYACDMNTTTITGLSFFSNSINSERYSDQICRLNVFYNFSYEKTYRSLKHDSATAHTVTPVGALHNIFGDLIIILPGLIIYPI
jgi:hypothetical protein